MSVILDALRKLDRERSSRRGGRGNIAAEILSADLPRPGRRIPLYIAVIVLTAVATAAITYGVVEFGFLTKSPPPSSKAPAMSQPMIPPSLNSASLSKPSSPLATNPPAPGQQAAPSSLTREPVHEVQEEARPLPPKIESPVEAKPSAASPSEKETSQRIPQERTETPPANTIKPAEQTPGESSTPPPLKLSAIVWYEEPSRRFAMVNGMIAYEGTLIEGVKVEEIYPNRVSFSHHGRFFEITLIK